MLGPTDAISRLGDMLSMTTISTRYYTILMQKDERQLWQKFGRGNKASVSYRSLLNLWLACILSNGQPPAGVQAAYDFSRLKLIGGVQRRAESLTPAYGANRLDPVDIRLEITETRRSFKNAPGLERRLIDLLSGLIRNVVFLTLSGHNVPGREEDWPVIRVTLGTDRSPMSAEVTWPEPGGSQNSETDLFALEEGLRPQLEAPQSLRRSALPETQIVIRRDAIVAFATLAMDTDDFADLLSQTSDPQPASRDDEGTTPETRKATEPASSGDLSFDVPATRAYPALAPAAALQAQSATNQRSKQSACGPVVRESRVRQPVTRKAVGHENWSLAS